MSTPNPVEFELWGRTTWPNREVAGESFHESEIRSLFPAGLGTEYREVTPRAALVPDPTNRHDPLAVKVIIAGKHVGFLPKEVAPQYQPLLLALQRQGIRPVTASVVRAAEYAETVGVDRRGRAIVEKHLSASVRLALDEWWLIVPANAQPPMPHALLPQGPATQVQKEEEHQDALAPFLTPQGETWAYGTLHVIQDQSTKTPKDLTEVRIDGRRVGQLTPAMSAEYIPIIRQLEGRGRVTAAKVVVKGNQIKADVVLHACRTNQLDARWIAANVPASAPASQPLAPQTASSPPPPGHAAATVGHIAVPPKPTRIRFNPPPGWPEPPAEWEPPLGWAPLADWPPAPSGWLYWIAGE